MGESKIQRSLARGEISPGLAARADHISYATGLKTCRNFMVIKTGGVQNRAGTSYIIEVKDSTKPWRLFKFVFSTDQTCVFEFGDQYLRIVQDGEQLVVDPDAWSGVTAYEIGDLVEDGGIAYYAIQAGTNHTPASSPDYWYPLTDFIYEVPTPWAAEDLRDIQYTQSNDVITFVHPDYPVYELARYAVDDWVLTEVEFGSESEPPENVVGVGESGPNSYEYQVTAIAENGEESAPGSTGTLTQATIIDITPTSSSRATFTTSAPHGFTTGQQVLISDVVATNRRAVNGKVRTVYVLGPDTFQLRKLNLFVFSYTSGGLATIVGEGVVNVNDPVDDPITITWDLVDGAREYRIYRSIAGLMGFIGISLGDSFIDRGFVPDTLDTPPEQNEPFGSDYPAAVGHQGQRLVMGGSNGRPMSFQGSALKYRHNFDIRRLLHDADAYDHTIDGDKVQPIRHLVDLNGLLILTAGGEFIAKGDAGVVTPAMANIFNQGTHGAAKLAPIIVDRSALYVQARGSIIRDIGFDFETDGYKGNDLTVLSAHLFKHRTVVAWAWSEIPQSILWVVLDNGALLSLTYIKEESLVGWARHDTLNGTFEDVISVPEGTEDAVYVAVLREIDGQEVRYMERLNTRQFTDVTTDAIFTDCTLSYDGTNTNQSHTLTLSGGTDWDTEETLTLTSSAGSYFDADEIGNEYVLTVGDDTVRVRVFGFTSDTEVSVHALSTVPAALRTVATGVWARAADEFEGLGHLEGETVIALADGMVQGADDSLVVTAGAVTLATPAVVVHIGLRITADIETLSIEDAERTLVDKRKLVGSVSLLVEETRGLKAGPDEDHLLSFIQRELEDLGSPTDLATGREQVSIDSTWNDNGRVLIRQDLPLPATILAVVPNGTIGGG